MAKVLYWNIQQFGINKISELGDNEPRKKQSVSSTKTMSDSENSKKRKRTGTTTYYQIRKEVILSTLSQNTPDIFVVVETSTGKKAPGTLITAGGAQGALLLLKEIRGLLSEDWMLVPPLVLGLGGVAEGISVYFNSSTVEFTGPWGWQGNAYPSVPVDSVAASALQEYSDIWANCLPEGKVTSTINKDIEYKKLAGQWEFSPSIRSTRSKLGFPGTTNRTPWLTTFWDKTANRTIKLLAFHASPKKNASAEGTNQLSKINEMTTNLQDDEVGVIVGDFNVDLFNTQYEPIAYNELINVKGYTRSINPTAVTTFPEKGYVCTMLKSFKSAYPWSPPGYPGFEYMIDKSYSSVDNILTKYGSNAGGPATNITIVNRITGAPYDKDTSAAASLPKGHFTYSTGMSKLSGTYPYEPAALPLPPDGPDGMGGFSPGSAGSLSTFKSWVNYRGVKSTSDHMALIIEI